MKIVLIAIGTRGDVEPFLAIADLLIRHGHEVVGAFPAQFQALNAEVGARFFPLTPKFLEMLDSELGKMVIGGKVSGIRKVRGMVQLYRISSGINKTLTAEQREVIEKEKPDLVIHSLKATYPVYWNMEHPGRAILVSPIPYVIQPTLLHSSIGFKGKNLGKTFNRWSYQLTNYFLSQNIWGHVKKYQSTTPVNRKRISKAILEERLIYTISPTLFQPEPNWGKHVQVLGYHERNKAINWNPDPTLTQFLARHPKVLLVTFGSMTNPEPEQKTGMILDILERYQIPAVINTSVGGLTEPETHNKSLFHFVSSIPYDWAFPKVYGVIHHGGSGTTHMVLKYGCASLIIPHIVDQFVWNEISASLGAGPMGIPINRINSKNLETKIVQLFNERKYKEKAEEIGLKIQNEDFSQQLYDTITRSD